MPELPEVETIKKGLAKSLKHKQIKEVFVYTDKMVKVGSGKISNAKKGSKKLTKEFQKGLQNRKVLKVERRAKYLIITFSNNYFLVIHLRMSGQLIFRNKNELNQPILLSVAKNATKEKLPSKHTHVQIFFKDGSSLFYNDTRQFGHLRLVNQKELTDVFKTSNLGPEPLTLTFSEFKKISQTNKNKRVKDFLLNQTVISGIGNIYADESLFLSKINPSRKISSLREQELKSLLFNIKKVLNKAISAGGSSIETFLTTNGSSGKYTEKHLVYGKAGKPCPVCKTKLVSKKIGSRTSTYCKHCQK